MTSTPSLTYAKRQFFLDGKPIRIFSGAIHYFRVVPEYWEDRLLKAKACGLNTIETYVPWNLHEPAPGVFNNDYILDLRRFITLARDLGFYVIFRPGPYICSEWDFGGLPSWLLADPDMKVRSNYLGYQKAVERYFSWLLPQVTDLQRSLGNGGPIIAVQVENEFGSYNEDPAHMIYIRDLMLQKGIVELLVSSDNESACRTAPLIPGVMPTANGQTVEELQASFEVIKKFDPEIPVMVMEFWTGWFDHWGIRHETRSPEILQKSLEFSFADDASVNFYMFHGGTNFGFLNGALDLSRYKADVTSYDYDAPLTEEGRTTEKYWKIRELVQKEVTTKQLNGVPELPAVPENSERAKEAIELNVDSTISWKNLLDLCVKRSSSEQPRFMETYSYGNDVQSYGYIVHRKKLNLSGGKSLAITGPIRDRALVLVDGKCLATFIRDNDEPDTYTVEIKASDVSEGESILEIIVENLGRVNYTLKDKPDMLNTQRKGLNAPVLLKGPEQQDFGELKDWEVMALDFAPDLTKSIFDSSLWEKFTAQAEPPKEDQSAPISGRPALYKASLELSALPEADYFVRLADWVKGIVIVNGFNLGRYWNIGPQGTLYLPKPLLREGKNDIVVFEECSPGQNITFDVEPCLDISQKA